MSIFSSLEATASRTIDQTHAERFRLTPRAAADPNGRRAGDPSRTAFDGIGVFDVMPLDFGIETGDRHIGGGNDLRAIGAGARYVLSVDVRQLAATPRQDDLVELLDRPGVPQYRVDAVRPDGQSRVELVLVR